MYALLHPSTRRRATSTQHTHIHDTHKQTQNTRNNIIIFALLSIVSSNETFLFASLISENFRAGNFVCYSQLEIEQKVFTQSTHTHIDARYRFKINDGLASAQSNLYISNHIISYLYDLLLLLLEVLCIMGFGLECVLGTSVIMHCFCLA